MKQILEDTNNIIAKARSYCYAKIVTPRWEYLYVTKEAAESGNIENNN